MSQRGIDGKDFIIGAFIGGLLGAAAALLLAPKSGRDLRKDISEQYSQVSEKSADIVKKVSETTVDLVGKAKETAGNVISEVKQWRDNNKQTASAKSAADQDPSED